MKQTIYCFTLCLIATLLFNSCTSADSFTSSAVSSKLFSSSSAASDELLSASTADQTDSSTEKTSSLQQSGLSGTIIALTDTTITVRHNDKKTYCFARNDDLMKGNSNVMHVGGKIYIVYAGALIESDKYSLWRL